MGKKKKSKEQHKRNIDSMFSKAFELHKTGDLEKANSIYQQILTSDPEHADSLYLSGAIAHQTNENQIAVKLIKKAIKINPDNSVYYETLCLALQALGKHEEAIAYYQTAIQLNPENSDLYNNLGLSFMELRKPDKALEHFKKALSVKPDHSFACNNLGLVYYAKKDMDEAEVYFRKAIEFNKNFPQAYNNLGLVLEASEKTTEAIECYKKAIALNDGFLEAYNNLGNVYQNYDQLSEALNCFEKVIQLNPGFAPVYNNIGNVLKKRGDLDRAVESYSRAISLDSDSADPYYNLGEIAHNEGQYDDAVIFYKKCIDINPDYAEAYNNLGNIYKDLNNPDEAKKRYLQSVQLNPDSASAYNNLGILYQEQNDMEEAVRCFEKALSIKPDMAEVNNNLGIVYKKTGDYDKAVECFQKSIQSGSDTSLPYFNLGELYKALSEYSKAASCFKNVLEIFPEHESAMDQLVSVYQKTCDWKNVDVYMNILNDLTGKHLLHGEEVNQTPHNSLSRSEDSVFQLKIASVWSRNIAKNVSRQASDFNFDGRSIAKDKLVIGYLSNTFRNHPGGHLVAGLFEHHNREKFIVNCYSYGRNDHSYYRNKAENDCDKFTDIQRYSHLEAARCIYNDGVDILIDLRGHTKDNRLEICALKPSPVQVVYLGFAGSSGAEFFDYIIADKTVVPEKNASSYSESIMYMPDCYQVNDSKQKISDKKWTRTELGLPENSFVFSSFNTAYKIEPVMFGCWMNILKRVPDSVLWLLKGNEDMENSLRREAESFGIKGNRLIFAEKIQKEDHLARYRNADLVLDTRIYNGHTTTSDALWAGVPVLTLLGNHFASRVSGSILKAIGLHELITHNLDEYENMAVRFAQTKEDLIDIKERLNINRLEKPLFDTTGFAAKLELGLWRMWDFYRAGKTPEQIDVAQLIMET